MPSVNKKYFHAGTPFMRINRETEGSLGHSCCSLRQVVPGGWKLLQNYLKRNTLSAPCLWTILCLLSILRFLFIQRASLKAWPMCGWTPEQPSCNVHLHSQQLTWLTQPGEPLQWLSEGAYRWTIAVMESTIQAIALLSLISWGSHSQQQGLKTTLFPKMCYRIILAMN